MLSLNADMSNRPLTGRECIAVDTRAWWYWLRLSFVAAVSAYDTYLTYVFREVILVMEQNPMGHWLIRLDPHRLVYFTAAKTVGTLAVISLLSAAAPMTARPRREGGLPQLKQCLSLADQFATLRWVVGPLVQMMRRYRETIISTVATFQLWLLWYLSF
jgi:hypothetical protein